MKTLKEIYDESLPAKYPIVTGGYAIWKKESKARREAAYYLCWIKTNGLDVLELAKVIPIQEFQPAELAIVPIDDVVPFVKDKNFLYVEPLEG